MKLPQFVHSLVTWCSRHVPSCSISVISRLAQGVGSGEAIEPFARQQTSVAATGERGGSCNIYIYIHML